MRFYVGDRVFILVSPMKRVMRFGRWGKLSPRYISPFEILKAIGEVAYELALPPVLLAIHPVFRFSVLHFASVFVMQVQAPVASVDIKLRVV